MNEHTSGPLAARRINDETRPFAVINPRGPFGDEIVAGFLSEPDAMLYAAAPDMLAELRDILEWALVEKTRLREQEIESIRRVIAKATVSAQTAGERS